MRWQVRKGSRRVVLALPQLGLVLKFPRLGRGLHTFLAIDLPWMLPEMRRSKHPERVKLFGLAAWYAFRRTCWGAFGGAVDNWRERNYYKHCKAELRPLLQPTYLSLLGLVNVQRLGEPTEDSAVCNAACRIIWPDAARDGHHWENSSNFDVSSGELRLLDYASLATQKIIDKHGRALLEKFKATFRPS